MSRSHKNKALTTLLTLLTGGLGLHRFYLYGTKDRIGWLHAASLPATLLLTQVAPGHNWFYSILPLLVSYIAGFIETLVIGLTPDDKWDALHNAGSGKQSESTWPLALLLVLTLMVGAVTLIATMSRLFDLLYTGGAYG